MAFITVGTMRPKEGKELTSSNDNQMVYYHNVGTSQSQDELAYEDKQHPQRFHQVATTEDERFAILAISDRGVGKRGNAIFFRDVTKKDRAWIPLIPEISDYSYGVIDHVGDQFLVQTNRNAPNWKVVLIDPKNPGERNWVEVLPEKPEPLQMVGMAGGKLFAPYLKDVTTRAYVYDLAGKLENEITLPGPGSASGFGGNAR